MRGLDLCCGAGGCSVGYARAGFDMTGVDNEPHPDYPFPFLEADALEVLDDRAFMDAFDFVHISTPCHDHSDLSALSGLDGTGGMLAEARAKLRAWGGLYVMENVEGAPMPGALLLCGSEFGLGASCRDGRFRYLRRHRLFESNVWLMGAGGCVCRGQSTLGVYGTGGGGPMTRGYKAHPEEARTAMGIDWMRREDIAQAIPPAYTEFIGGQLAAVLEESAA